MWKKEEAILLTQKAQHASRRTFLCLQLTNLNKGFLLASLPNVSRVVTSYVSPIEIWKIICILKYK